MRGLRYFEGDSRDPSPKFSIPLRVMNNDPKQHARHVAGHSVSVRKVQEIVQDGVASYFMCSACEKWRALAETDIEATQELLDFVHDPRCEDLGVSCEDAPGGVQQAGMRSG